MCSTFSFPYASYFIDVILCLGLCSVKQGKFPHEILDCLKGVAPKKLK